MFKRVGERITDSAIPLVVAVAMGLTVAGALGAGVRADLFEDIAIAQGVHSSLTLAPGLALAWL